MQHLLETLEAGTRRVGNVIDGEGKPISAEKILDLFDKIAISFDPNGRPQMPTGLAGGAQAEAYRVQLARIDTEPALKARMKQIIDRKREEWRAGEAHRVLVG
jgi:hypothetical protein